jgi:two-component system, OmpR family, sensor histidine kinase BaeS
MFRTLRQRLIWSQIIPLLIVLPVMGLVLIYTLESQFLIPRLAQNLMGDARLLSEISSSEFELWGNPVLFENLISRVQLDSAIRVMFLDSDGRLLYSSDNADLPSAGKVVDAPGLAAAQRGRESALTTYSILQTKNVMIDIYEPVTASDDSVVGVVRLTYRVASLYELFGEMRWQIALALVLGLVLSAIIGTWLAISISQPVSQVTKAIYDLAIGKRHEPLDVKGPEELRSQAQAVNFLVDQLHTMENSRRQLLANLVHELGRPLGAIRSAIHALANGADRDPVLFKDLTGGMDDETIRLQHLLDDLANLYDQSMGGLELNIRATSVQKWLPGVLRSWQSAAQEKQIHWEENIQKDIPPLPMDGDRMAQVVGNLLSNAVKYTKSGGDILVSVLTDEKDLFIKIKDTGSGIRPDEQNKVFLPFYRGDQGKRIKQGMGLGLPIARDLTVAHGGELTFRSDPGFGSTFTVSIPLEQTNQSEPGHKN